MSDNPVIGTCNCPQCRKENEVKLNKRGRAYFFCHGCINVVYSQKLTQEIYLNPKKEPNYAENGSKTVSEAPAESVRTEPDGSAEADSGGITTFFG